MTPLFKKLNYRGQAKIVVLNAPPSFESALEEMRQFTEVLVQLKKTNKLEFVLTFVTKQEFIKQQITSIYPLLEGDAIIWFAYPKKSSKKYKSAINRDSGWESLGEYGLEGVRQVAIDDDWSALRFRKREFIKVLNRDKSRVLSQEGNIHPK